MAVILARNNIATQYVPFEPDQPNYFRHSHSYGDVVDGLRLNEPPFDHITSATQTKRTNGRVPDIITVRTIRVCSRRFKDFLEFWEPGLHFFQPFELKRASGEVVGEYFKYGVGQDIDCLLTDKLTRYFRVEETSDRGRQPNFDWREAIKQAWYQEKYPDKSDHPPIEISGPAVQGAHLWTMGRLVLGGCDEPMVMSDAMYAAFRNEKFGELYYHCKAHEIDRPWIAEENMGPMIDVWRERERQIATHWPRNPQRRGKQS